MKDTPWKVGIRLVTKYGGDNYSVVSTEGEWLISYGSPILFKPFDIAFPICLDERYWNYSRTTSKYRNLILGEDTKATRAKIAKGEYLLINLA